MVRQDWLSTLRTVTASTITSVRLCKLPKSSCRSSSLANGAEHRLMNFQVYCALFLELSRLDGGQLGTLGVWSSDLRCVTRTCGVVCDPTMVIPSFCGNFFFALGIFLERREYYELLCG
jgi:hypothetical protein